MKKLLLSIALFSCATLVSAQENQTFILSNPQQIGQNLKTNTPIQGMSYVFESPINDLSIDVANNTALVLMQHTSKYFSKGVILDYNLTTNKLEWEKQTNLNQEKVILFPGQAIITNNKTSYALNPASGESSWQNKTDFFYTNSDLKIGIGFPQKKFTVSSELTGISLTDGAELWKRKLSHHFGINSITPLDNSTVLIVTDKLYAINLKTGNGWEYAINTGTTTFPETASLKVDPKYIEDINYNFLQDGRTVCGIVSTPIVKDRKIYIVSEEAVNCLSSDGKAEWTTPITEKFSSRSRIFIENDRLYVVNTGYAYYDNKKIQYGEAYVAAFDIKNGQQIYQTKLEKGFIADYLAADGSLFLLQTNKILEINLATGEISRKENLESNRYDIIAFAHIDFYTENGNKFNKLASNKEQLYLISNQNKLIEFNLNTKVYTIVSPEKLYRELFKVNEQAFISQNKNAALLDSQNQAVATFQIGTGSFLEGNAIYSIVNNILYRVEVNAITGK